MIGHEALRRWAGVPLLTVLSFPRLWGLEARVDAPAPLSESARTCRRIDDELSECALLDERGAGAQQLRGLEWVLSDAGYRKLGEAERPCWRRHPAGFWVSRGLP